MAERFNGRVELLDDYLPKIVKRCNVSYFEPCIVSISEAQIPCLRFDLEGYEGGVDYYIPFIRESDITFMEQMIGGRLPDLVEQIKQLFPSAYEYLNARNLRDRVVFRYDSNCEELEPISLENIFDFRSN